jgi:hypothetical protein
MPDNAGLIFDVNLSDFWRSHSAKYSQQSFPNCGVSLKSEKRDEEMGFLSSLSPHFRYWGVDGRI